MATIFATTITVTTAGTAQQVSTAPRPFVWAMFHNTHDNTGDVYIGDSNVSASNGLTLHRVTGSSNSRSEVTISGKLFAEDPPLDLKDFWVDVGTNGDIVEILAKVL